MDKQDFEINKKVMMEYGLDERDHRRLYDQDTGQALKQKGRYIVSPESQSGKNSTEFDPVNNPKQMNMLFASFAEKIADEGIMNIVSYHPVETPSNKVILEVKTDDEVIRSKEYNNDALTYADIMMQINGAQNVNLSEYDRPKEELERIRKEKYDLEKQIQKELSIPQSARSFKNRELKRAMKIPGACELMPIGFADMEGTFTNDTEGRKTKIKT